MADPKLDGKEDNNTLFLKFGNQDLPVFREVKNKDYVYYGEKNDYPYYLVDLYTESAYHKAIVDGKVRYICGAGWGVKTDGMNTEQKALASRMLEQPLGIDDLNTATIRWSMDAEILNGVTIKGVWRKDKKGADLSYIDMANIRTNPDESKFYYTAKWFNQNPQTGARTVNNKPEEAPDWKVYDKYDPNNRTGEFIYYWKAPFPTQKVYPIPVYQGAVRWINIDISLAKYFHNIVTNGFLPTHLINFFNGEPSPEKSQEMERKIKEKWSGVNGQPIIVNFAKNKETAADVQTLQMTDADKQYQEVRKNSEQAIFTGHGVTSPMLFGIKTEGQLGGNNELQVAEANFIKAYVKPRQYILESIINEFAVDFGLGATFYLNKVQNVAYMPSDALIESVLNQDEKRQLVLDALGIKEIKLPQGQKFSSQESELIEKFESIAKDYPNSTLLYEREITDFSPEAIRESENNFMSMHFEDQIKANTLERSIIDLLSKDNTLQPEAIAKATKSDVEKVKATIADLVDRKILKSSSIAGASGNLEGYEVTDKGFTTLDQKPAKTASIKIVYRYGLSSEFKGQDEIKDNSHAFCKKIVALSQSGKRWTSEDIFNLDNGTDPKYDMNAWTNRGGWYTKPKTEIHIPHCRHSWVQELRSVITD